MVVSFSGTFTIGAGSIPVSGTYLGTNNWALVASTTLLTLKAATATSSAITLSDAQVAVCSQPTTGDKATAPAPFASACPNATGGVVAQISGTLTIGAGSIPVSGTYLGTNNWAVAATTASLTVKAATATASAITLTNAQVVACSQPTSGDVATPPALTGLPTGVTQLSCPAATGAVVVSFSGTITVLSTPVKVSGTYLGSGNWAAIALVDTLALGGSNTLTGAQVALCSQPTTGDKATPPALSGLATGVTQLDCPNATGSVVASFSGTLSVGDSSILVSGSYLGPNNWAVAASAPSVTLKAATATASAITLTGVQLAVCSQPTSGDKATPLGSLADSCPSATGSVTGRFSGTLAIGAGSILVSGSYLGPKNWAVAGSTASLTLKAATSTSSAITLTNAQFAVCNQPTTGDKATPPAPLASACPAATGAVVVSFSGTVTLLDTPINVSGMYLGASNWAATALVSTLPLNQSNALTNAQITVCSQPTIGDKATPPALTGLAAGVTQLACPVATGSVAVSFAGTFTIGAGSISVSVQYLDRYNWAAAGSTASLTLKAATATSGAITLSDAQVVVCNQPTTGDQATPPALNLAPGVVALPCLAARGELVAQFSGKLMVGDSAVAMSGAYRGSTQWALAGAVNSMQLTPSTSLTGAQAIVCSGNEQPPALIGLPVGVTQLRCPSPSEGVKAQFSGTLLINDVSIVLKGDYQSSSDFSISGSVSTLALTSSLTLESARITASKSASGFSVQFAGDAVVGSSRIALSGSYLNSGNWAINGSLSSLTVGSGVDLKDVQMAICRQPVTGEKATLPTLTGSGVTSQLACPAATGSVVAQFAGTLNFGGLVSLAVTAAYAGRNSYSLTFATSVNVGTFSMALSGYLLRNGSDFRTKATLWTGALDDASRYTCTVSACSSPGVVGANASALSMGGGVTIKGQFDLAVSGSVEVEGAVVVGLGSLSINAKISFSSGGGGKSWSITVDVPIPLDSSRSLRLSGALQSTNGNVSGKLTLGTGRTGIGLLSGVTLRGEMSFTYDSTKSGASFEGSLQLSITVGSGTLMFEATLSFANSANWSATLKFKSGAQIEILPGFTLPTDFTGTIASNEGVFTWSLGVTIGSVTLVEGLLSLNSVKVNFGSTCDPVAGVTLCRPSSDGILQLSMSGKLVMNVLSLGAQTVDFGAVYDGGFRLVASIPSINIAGFATINNPIVKVASNDSTFTGTPDGPTSLGAGSGSAGGFAIAISGSVSLAIAGQSAVTINVAMTYMNGGFAIAATFPDGALSLGGDVTGLTLNTLVFLDKAGVVTVGRTASNGAYRGGLEVSVPAKTLVIAGKFVMPDWIASTLGLGSSPSVDVYVTYTSVNQFSLSAAFKQSSVTLPNQGSYTFTFTYLTVTVEKSLTGVAVSLRQQGKLGVPASSDRAAFTIPITLSATGAIIGGQTKITFAVSAGCPLAQCPTATPIWSNAMGITGLSINSLSFSLSITIVPGAPFPLPGIGFSATGTLPASLLSSLGIGAGADLPVSIAFNLDSTNPCIAVTLGTEDGPTFLKLGGVVTASYANIVVAPNGCTIGEFVVPAGFSLGFKGSFFQVPVVVLATMTLSPFTLDATVQIGDGIEGSPAFKIGSFTVYDTYLRVSIKPGASSAEFRGRITLGEALDVHLKGFFKTDGAFSIDGAIDLKVAGFTLQAKVIASAEAAAKNPKVEVFAYVNIPNVLEVTLSGAFRGYMDMELHGKADFRPGGYKMAALDFDLVLNSSAQYFRAHGFIKIGEIASANMSVALLNQNGSFAFYIYADAQVNLANIITGDGHFLLTNCSNVNCLDQPGKPNVARLSDTRAHLDATTRWGGFQMGVEVDIDAAWGFTATLWLQIDVVTPRVDVIGVYWWAEFHGQFSITISNLHPYVWGSVSFEVSVWNCSSVFACSPNRAFRVGAGLSINPNYFWVTVGGRSYYVYL